MWTHCEFQRHNSDLSVKGGTGKCEGRNEKWEFLARESVNSSPILARQWWRHFRLSLSVSLSLSLSLSPKVSHAQYRKRFRASYNTVHDLAEYQDIIQEYNEKLSDIGPKNLVLKWLERCWCITETKSHDFELVMPYGCVYRGLRNILLTNMYLIVSWCKSSFVKYVFPCTVSKISSICGKHAQFLMMIRFRSLQSETKRRDPSCFLTNKTGAPKGDLLGSVNPHSSRAVNCRCSSSKSGWDKRQAAWLGGDRGTRNKISVIVNNSFGRKSSR